MMGIRALRSKNITIQDNVLYGSRSSAISLESVQYVVINSNLIVSNQLSGLKYFNIQAAVDVCVGKALSYCKNVTVTTNRIEGGKGIGWLVPISDC